MRSALQQLCSSTLQLHVVCQALFNLCVFLGCIQLAQLQLLHLCQPTTDIWFHCEGLVAWLPPGCCLLFACCKQNAARVARQCAWPHLQATRSGLHIVIHNEAMACCTACGRNCRRQWHLQSAA